MAEEHGQVIDEELDAEREARRQLALAQIRQWPDPALRMQAHEVESFDDDLRLLVERMKTLMADANGVGLAATQVGVLRRVFVFRHGDEEDGVVEAVVNPELAEHAEEVGEDEEGCLSLQGVRIPVPRYVTVTIEGRNESDDPVRIELTDLDARVAQHELDHLNGVLILDRTTPEGRREALAVLRPHIVLR